MAAAEGKGKQALLPSSVLWAPPGLPQQQAQAAGWDALGPWQLKAARGPQELVKPTKAEPRGKTQPEHFALDQLLLQGAKKEGATVLTGGKRPPNMPKGFFVEPTIFCGPKIQDLTVWHEEVHPALVIT